MLISLLVFDNLDCDNLTGFVIETLERLAKAALTEKVKHFKSIVYVIFEDHIIVPVFIVISRIIKLSTSLTFDLFGLQTQEIYFLEVKQFSLLKIGQFSRLRVQLEGLADGHRILNDGFLLGIGCQNVNNFFG